jgi:hypothetical protein
MKGSRKTLAMTAAIVVVAAAAALVGNHYVQAVLEDNAAYEEARASASQDPGNHQAVVAAYDGYLARQTLGRHAPSARAELKRARGELARRDEEARSLASQATADENAGRWGGAADRWLSAFRLSGSPEHRRNAEACRALQIGRPVTVRLDRDGEYTAKPGAATLRMRGTLTNHMREPVRAVRVAVELAYSPGGLPVAPAREEAKLHRMRARFYGREDYSQRTRYERAASGDLLGGVALPARAERRVTWTVALPRAATKNQTVIIGDRGTEVALDLRWRVTDVVVSEYRKAESAR